MVLVYRIFRNRRIVFTLTIIIRPSDLTNSNQI